MSVTELKTQIKAIDRKVNAIHRQMRSLETIDLESSASWQAAWDKHPDLHAEEKQLYRQRGELQITLAEAEYKHNRPKNLRFMTESQKLKLALRELKSLVKRMEYPKFPATEKALYLELAHKAIDRIEAA